MTYQKVILKLKFHHNFSIFNNLREKFSPGPGIEPGSPAGDPGWIPDPGKNFSLKLLIYDLSEGYSKAKISS